MFYFKFCIFYLLFHVLTAKTVPVVVTTWNFVNASAKAWEVLERKGTSVDAVEVAGTTCEELQCDGTVGYGGSPDEEGETTLDAMIMDGRNLNIGAVAGLRRVKGAISVARHILEQTSHSMLSGDLATKFAIQMGFKEESLSSVASQELWEEWKNNKCQPNFWINVKPDPKDTCGPYRASPQHSNLRSRKVDESNHDTIGVIAIDKSGNVAAGTSTNGAKFKIPGRVGDSPIPGAGAYADNEVGGAAATGDGDVMMRVLPSFLAVEEMRRGATPQEAAEFAVARIAKHYPAFSGAVIAINIKGEYGAACHELSLFPFVVQHKTTNGPKINYVSC